MHHHLLCQTEFHPVLTLSFLFPEPLHCCYIYFHCSYMYNYYNYLDLYELNAEFQHFIPTFLKNSLLKIPYFADPTQRGNRESKEAQRQGEDRMTLRKTFSVQLGLGFRLGSPTQSLIQLELQEGALGSSTQKGAILIYLIKNRQD